MINGEVFVQEGLISQEQLDQAIAKQKELGGNEPIGNVLVSMGYVSERDRVRCMGRIWGVEFIDLAEHPPDSQVVGRISSTFAKKFKVLPVRIVEGRLLVAMANPLDIFVIDELRLLVGMDVEPLITVEEELTDAIASAYANDGSVSDALKGVIEDFDGDIEITAGGDEDELTADELRNLGEEAPIVRLANLIINQAIADGASDIHIEPRRNEVKVRIRMDGVMHEAMTLPKKVQAPLISRFKIMAEMDIAEKRAPQDNR
ncbi:MAG: type II secretion system protein GspE, partial [Armatimonadota bacterium]